MSGRMVHVVRSDVFAGVERTVVDAAGALHERGWTVSMIGGEPVRTRAELAPGIGWAAGATVGQVAVSLRALGPVDILHAHITSAELPAALLNRRLRARLVVTRHVAAARGRTVGGRLARPLIDKRLDAELAVSDFVAASLIEPTVVVHNGVAPSRLGAVRRPRSRSVVVVQRLEPEKDTATALHAWALSGLGGDGWQLVVHGTGSESERLRHLAADLGLRDSVVFAGPTITPRAVLADASITLATGPAESFGLGVVESMAEATPVVAADGGAHRETLGADGRFFPPRDVGECARHLQLLAVDEDARQRLGARLQERQQVQFSLRAHVDRLEQVYERLTRMRRG